MRSTPGTRRLRRHGFDRRSFVIGATASGLLVACGGAGGAASKTESVPGDGVRFDDEYLLLQAGFADGLRAPSTLVSGRLQRAPFVLYGADALPAVNAIPATVSATLWAPDATSTEVSMARHDAGIPTPYYPLLFEATQSGIHRLEAKVSGELQVVEFAVAEPSDVDLVQVGDPMRSVDTPTVDDPKSYAQLCTRLEPCPFHTINLRDALANGRPTVMIISTPGFCQTVICGPVLELLIEADPGAGTNVIHVEVYTDPDRLGTVDEISELVGPVVAAYGMDFEPSLVVADESGIVTARLDFAFDRTELNSALPVTR